MRKILLIANPKSGIKNNNELVNIVINKFKENSIEITLNKTEYPGHAIELAKNCNFSEFSSICAVGGDGTLNEVLNGVLKRNDKKKIPIGLIPGGTGNSFMKTLEFLDPIKAITQIIKNKTRPVDVIKVNCPGQVYYSLNLVGWGMATDISVFAEKLRILGEQRYNIASIFEIIKNKKRPASLILDGKKIVNDFCFIIACNTKYVGKGMKMAPEADLEDGLIDVIIVRKSSSLKLFNVFPKLFNGSHIFSPLCEYVQVKSLEINPKINTSLNIDGEIIGETPAKLNVLPKYIDLLM